MSPGRTLILAHLFLRHRPGISPSETVPRIFFHEHGAKGREGKTTGSRRNVGWTFPSGEFSCLRNKKLMRNATARCIWFRLHRQTEEMTAGAPIGHFEIEYAASLRLPAWSRPFSFRRPTFRNSCNLPSRSDGNFLAARLESYLR